MPWVVFLDDDLKEDGSKDWSDESCPDEHTVHEYISTLCISKYALQRQVQELTQNLAKSCRREEQMNNCISELAESKNELERKLARQMKKQQSIDKRKLQLAIYAFDEM